MPSSRPPSQPDGQPYGWLRSPAGRLMLAEIKRLARPELTRVFGQYGLYLCPSDGLSPELSGNMLANVLSLHRDQDQLSGPLRCLDAELPISSASLSLVYALFMLESSPEPEALMGEIARSLQPEGVALVISLNPWGAARLRWLLNPRPVAGLSSVRRWAQEAGLEVIRQYHLGPIWPRTGSQVSGSAGNSWLDGFRVASLSVLRRRELALTPLRKAAAAVSLRPGMSAG